MSNFKYDQICQTSSMGATLLDVCTTGECYNSCLPGAGNAPLAVLPLLAQQHFETDDADCHSDSRAVIREKVLASLDCTDVTNMGNIHYYQ